MAEEKKPGPGVEEEEIAEGGPEEATHPGDPEAPAQHPLASGVGGLAGGAAGAAVGAAIGGPAGAVAGAMVGGAAGVAAGKGVAEERHPADDDPIPRDERPPRERSRREE